MHSLIFLRVMAGASGNLSNGGVAFASVNLSDGGMAYASAKRSKKKTWSVCVCSWEWEYTSVNLSK